jgi:ribosomal protein L28
MDEIKIIQPYSFMIEETKKYARILAKMSEVFKSNMDLADKIHTVNISANDIEDFERKFINSNQIFCELNVDRGTFREFYENTKSLYQTVTENENLWSTVAINNESLTMRKLAVNMQKHFLYVTDLGNFTKIEFCEMAKRHNISPLNMIRLLYIMTEHNVTLKDCKSDSEMKDFKTLLETLYGIVI